MVMICVKDSDWLFTIYLTPSMSLTGVSVSELCLSNKIERLRFVFTCRCTRSYSLSNCLSNLHFNSSHNLYIFPSVSIFTLVKEPTK